MATGDERVIVGGEAEAGRCPACGHDAADGRFCGRCGKRLRGILPAQALASAEESPAPVLDELVWGADGAADDGVAEVQAPDARPHRRVFVTVFTLVAVVAAALVIAGARGPAEVVTTGPSGPGTGVTSTIAATDLTTEMWRTPVRWDPGFRHVFGDRPAQLVGATGEVVVVASDGRSDVFDRASGDRLGRSLDRWSPLRAGRTEDPVTVVDGGELITLDPVGGRVLRTVPAEPVAGHVVGEPVSLPGGDLVLSSSQELRRVGSDGSTHWSQPRDPADWAWEVLPHDGALLMSSQAGLSVLDPDSGELRWSVSSSPMQQLHHVAVPGGRVAAQDGARVTMYDLATGAEVWTTEERPEPDGFIGVRDGVLYATILGRPAQIGRYDVATGARLPGYDLAVTVDRDDQPHPEVAIVDDLLVAAGGGEIVALGLDGRERWRVAGHSWTTVADGTLLVLHGADLSVADPATGELRLESELDLPARVTRQPVAVAVSGASASLPDGRVVALETGEQLADLAGDEPWAAVVPIGGGYLSQDPGTMGMRATDIYGTTRWRTGPASEAVPVGDRVVATVRGPSGSEVSLIDVATGAVTGGDLPALPDNIVLSDGRWAVGFAFGRGEGGSEEVIVLRRQDDDLVEVWRDEGWYATALWNGEEVLGHSVRGVERRSLVDGSPLPGVRLPVAVVSAAFGPDTFVFTTGDDRVLGVDPETTEVRWETSVDGVLSDRLTIAGDVAYLGTLDGRVHLVRLGDGELLDSIVVGEEPVSQIVVAYGVMLVALGDEVVAFGPASPDDLRIPDLPPRELGEVDVPVP